MKFAGEWISVSLLFYISLQLCLLQAVGSSDSGNSSTSSPGSSQSTAVRNCSPTDMPFPPHDKCTCVDSSKQGTVSLCGNTRKSSFLANKNNCGDSSNFGLEACHLYAYTVCISKSSPHTAVASNGHYILNISPTSVLVIPTVPALGYEEHSGVDPNIWNAAYRSALNGKDNNPVLSLSACSQRQYSQMHIHIGKAKPEVAKVFNNASKTTTYQNKWAPLTAPKSSGGPIRMFCTEERPSFDFKQTDIFKMTSDQIPASGFSKEDVSVAIVKAENGIFICLVNKDNNDLFDYPSDATAILKGGIE